MPSRDLVIVPNPQSGSARQFDYNGLSPDIALDARSAARRIQTCLKRAAITIGRDLLSIKNVLPHGKFAEWVGLEFRMSIRTAQLYMSVAREFEGEKGESVSYLPPTALFALSRKSTPQRARDRLLAQIALVADQGKLRLWRSSKRPCHLPSPRKSDLTGWLWTGLIERISQARRSWT